MKPTVLHPVISSTDISKLEFATGKGEGSGVDFNGIASIVGTVIGLIKGNDPPEDTSGVGYDQALQNRDWQRETYGMQLSRQSAESELARARKNQVITIVVTVIALVALVGGYMIYKNK
jgi:hypothetical protein